MSRTSQRIRSAAMRLFTDRGSTHLSVQELARAADVARGTVYSHVRSIDALFAELAAELTEEMSAQVVEHLEGETDPARRLHLGMRRFLARAHAEPAWGRFLVRFAMAEPSLAELWTGTVYAEIAAGVTSGRFRVPSAEVPTLIALLAGSQLSAMFLVLEGHRTWRAASSELSRFALRGLGMADEDIDPIVAT